MSYDFSSAHGNTDTLFCTYPPTSVPGDAIVAFWVFDHASVSALGDDVLSLNATVSQGDWGGGDWEQQWFYGVRGAETGDNFYLSAPADQMVILVSFSTDNAGAALGGVGNSVFAVTENSPTITPPVSDSFTAATLGIASVWASAPLTVADLNGSLAGEIATAETISGQYLSVAIRPDNGSGLTWDIDTSGVMDAYSTLDARYVAAGCTCQEFEYHYRWPQIRDLFTAAGAGRAEAVRLLTERDRELLLYLANGMCNGNASFEFPHTWPDINSLIDKGRRNEAVLLLTENDQALEDHLSDLPCNGQDESLGVVCHYEYPYRWAELYDDLFDDRLSHAAALLLERRDSSLEDWLRHRTCA